MRHQRFSMFVLTAASSLFCSSVAQAEVRPVGLFTSHMVLQRDQPVPVWGTAEAGEQVVVTFGDQKQSTTADEKGKWKVQLSPLKVSAEPRDLLITGTNSLKFEDVLVGDVWVCAGQSNMELAPARGFKDPDAIAKTADLPLVRMITLNKVVALGPLSDVKGNWAACTPDLMKRFSAAAFICGRDIHKELQIPIGLIGMYYGGSNGQAWTRRDALLSDPDLANYVTQAEAARGGGARGPMGGAAAAPVDPNAPPTPMQPGTAGLTSRYRPANFYNGMVAPTMPFAIKGVLWYQGESNTNNARDAALYGKLFPLMIKDWRAQWGQGDFPFVFVQLPACEPQYPEPTDSAWARLRESQQKALDLPGVHMVVGIDLAHGMDVHAPNKLEIGQRLGATLLQHVYKKADVKSDAPLLDNVKIDGSRAIVKFRHADGGLVSKNAEGVKGFAIAGADQKYVWAQAEIQGDTVIVTSPEVAAPVSVRYAWADNPVFSLYSQSGVPAAPFRSDDYPATNITNPRAAP